MRRSFLLLFLVLAAPAFAQAPAAFEPKAIHVAEPTDYPAEAKFRKEYFATPVVLVGTVLDEDGSPMEGARVVLADDATQVTTDESGTFFFPALERRNRVVQVRAKGYHTFPLAVILQVPIEEEAVLVDPVLMTRDRDDTVRFFFTGDIAIGRRFFDPFDLTPRNQLFPDFEGAMMKPSTVEEDTRLAVSFVKPMVHADYMVANLENPVTLDPSTPHWEKPFAFFTYPGSLPPLRELGVDVFTLGNNHLYDYLESGITETFKYLDEAGFPACGAGRNADEAFEPCRADIKGWPYSILALNSISGNQYRIPFQATEDRGGAADLRDDDRIIEVTNQELAAGRIPIAALHTGIEYVMEAAGYALNRMLFMIDTGSKLVIAHHPHTAQGFSMYDGVLVSQSGGNFIFDQDRLETMLGIEAIVDMRGDQVTRARGLPVYLEDFRPRPINGELASLLLRRLSEYSVGLTAFPYNGRVFTSFDGKDVVVRKESRTVEVTIPAQGWTVLDLRGLASTHEASLFSARTSAQGLTARPGRDIMYHGDFEDHDVDPDSLEVSRWDVTGDSRFPCMFDTWRGAVSVCSTRSAKSTVDSVVAFRARTRVEGNPLNEPNKDITLFGYMRGENAGPVDLITRYFASKGELEFGEEVAYQHAAGTYGWERIMTDVNFPADTPFEDPALHEEGSPRALRIFMRHGAPKRGDALVSFDDIAFPSWEEKYNLTAGFELKTPHMRDFLRIEGSPGAYDVDLTFDVHRPAVAVGCTPGPLNLCLNAGRFKVQAFWQDAKGNSGVGRAELMTADTGYFWFFGKNNVEIVIKVLNGSRQNGNYWTFYGGLSNVEYTLVVTDTLTGRVRVYTNPLGKFGSRGDTESFPVELARRSRAVASAVPEVAEAAVEELAVRPKASCVEGPRTLCLNGGRFQVELDWADPRGNTGAGMAKPMTGDTGYFWFFGENNVEVVVKVLDGLRINGHYWVFYGSLTSVEFRMTVTDTVTGKSKRYTNKQGNFASAGDIEALKP